MSDPRQLEFDLPYRPSLDRGAYFVSDSNSLTLAQIDDWRSWSMGRMALVGPPGSGKTHLAHVFAQGTGARFVQRDDLLGDPVSLATAPALILEDVDRDGTATGVHGEAMFHLLNAAQAAGAPVLMTARRRPEDWGAGSRDLASRIEAAGRASLPPPDDLLLQAVLMKLFADRQVRVRATVPPYLAKNMERTFDAAQSAVSRICAVAIRSRSAITRELARKAMGWHRDGLVDKLPGNPEDP